MIAESIFATIDDEGRMYQLLREITDHRSDNSAVKIDDGYVDVPGRPRRRRITTKGWELRVTWKDGATDWIPLKDLKEAYPVQTAEYAVANKITEEPALRVVD